MEELSSVWILVAQTGQKQTSSGIYSIFPRSMRNKIFPVSALRQSTPRLYSRTMQRDSSRYVGVIVVINFYRRKCANILAHLAIFWSTCETYDHHSCFRELSQNKQITRAGGEAVNRDEHGSRGHQTREVCEWTSQQTDSTSEHRVSLGLELSILNVVGNVYLLSQPTPIKLPKLEDSTKCGIIN